MSPRALLPALALLLSATAACVDNPTITVDADPHFYRCRVQPVFDRGCSALACHGDPRRPLHTFTRHRARLDAPDTDRNLPMTARELDANFASAAAFAVGDPAESLLLLKPLDGRAGGYFHLGRELFGGDDVWMSRDEEGYRVVEDWLMGATEDPGCYYAGEH